MKATIIITNYNKEQYLTEAIESALSQDFFDFEVLIIDDGSTDKSASIIKSFQEKNSLIRTIYQNNKGVIATRNIAIKQAKGEYIVQLDGDDKLDKNYLKWTVPILSNSDELGIVFCKTEFFGLKTGVWDLGEYSLVNQLTTNQIVVTGLFRKADFLRTKGYNQDFAKGYEDWDFWLSLLDLGLQVHKINKVGFYYRIIENSRNSSFSKDVERQLKTLIYKGHPNLYLSNGLDPVNLLWKIKEKDLEIYDLKLFKNSLEYKVGHLFLFPLRLIQKLFKQFL
tara:strand:- start:172 stop:1014 length:843 start_codon:yes stop_codon:yes gene_type:complete